MKYLFNITLLWLSAAIGCIHREVRHAEYPIVVHNICSNVWAIQTSDTAYLGQADVTTLKYRLLGAIYWKNNPPKSFRDSIVAGLERDVVWGDQGPMPYDISKESKIVNEFQYPDSITAVRAQDSLYYRNTILDIKWYRILEKQFIDSVTKSYEEEQRIADSIKRASDSIYTCRHTYLKP